jgi:hypothetical protein
MAASVAMWERQTWLRLCQVVSQHAHDKEVVPAVGIRLRLATLRIHDDQCREADDHRA